MVPHRRVRRNTGGKLPVSIKYQNLHSFKEGMIHLCQSILETRRISHLHGSALFIIPLRTIFRSFSLKCELLLTGIFIGFLCLIDMSSIFFKNHDFE